MALGQGCPCCGRVTLDPPADPRPHRCGPCITAPPAFERVHAAWVYGAAIRDAISRWKNRPEPILAGPLGALLIEALATAPPDLGPDAIVVPVPSARARILQRGLNPAGVLAARVARGLGYRLASGALTVARLRERSRGLGRRDRAKHVKGAFQAHAHVIRGRPVLLVDDVVTTGATVAECAQLLRKAGATRVEVVALARVPTS